MSVNTQVDYTNLATIKEFYKALVKGGKIKTQDDLYGTDGIIKQLQKGLYEGLLEGELDHHLGYNKHEESSGENYRNGHSEKTIKTQQGDIQVDIPRDRNGSFDPIIIAKHQKRAAIIDDTIIGLYSKGMSLSQIKAQILEVYQLELSEDQISKITDSVLEEVAKWHIRPLASTYPIVYLDGIYINVLDNKTVIKKVVYVALGVNVQGHKELLGLWISESEGSKFWLNVLTDLHNRGLRQVCVFCVDGLTGFPEAINSVFPKSMVQQCIVHAVRRSLDYISYKRQFGIRKFRKIRKSIYKYFDII